MEKLNSPELLPYLSSCQMCEWYVFTEDLSTAHIAGTNHCEAMIHQGKLHQVWVGLQVEKPEWIR